MVKQEDYKLESPNSFVDRILSEAIDNRASDIHLEPERESLNVRFRIDGLLHQIQILGKYSQEGVISRVKVLSQIDITEHRLPQGGHFEFQYKDVIYNIRISTLPTLYGEAIVFRILNRRDTMISLENLGFEKEQLAEVQKLIKSPSGMILISGPTSSGKTSLLYSILDTLNSPSKNIVTIEDPVEFQMSKIRQTQINEAMGLTFAKAMRSVIRQDPDIIMVGEIRDADTAQMAIQAALIGVLVFSTFHTFDVPALITRLFEMGISNSSVAQAIEAVISTSLVRMVCGTCKDDYQPSELEKQMLGDKIRLPSSFKKGRGCEVCKNTGYLGRTGIFELIYFDDEIKASIIEQKPPSYMYEILKRKNIRTLKDVAIQKVLSGVTTVDEIVRVLGVFSFQ